MNVFSETHKPMKEPKEALINSECRMGEEIFLTTRRKIAGIAALFQDFATQLQGKLTVHTVRLD